ncbi:MAG: dTDP-glucose 4,6-dehydratase [Candidatus Aenigmatarchaeota archaeon]
MRILTIGTAGFMGSNFVRKLAKIYNNHEILIADKLTYAGRIENIKDILSDRVKFVKCDISNFEEINKIIKDFKPEIIINFAAESHVDRSINEPALFIKTNIIGVFNILESIKEINRNIVYYHISTDEVYGDILDLYGKDAEVDESYPLNPSSPYSASKASADLLIKAYGRTFGIKYVIIRPSNNYGPYQHPEKLIPRTIIRLLLGYKATIYGDGSSIRDYIYVDDFVDGVITILEKGKLNEIYNICAGNKITIREVVEKIVKLLGKDVEKDIKYVSSRPGEDKMYSMKCEKLRALGWEPKHSFEEGLRKTIDWYIKNRWWWEPLIDEYVIKDEVWKKY